MISQWGGQEKKSFYTSVTAMVYSVIYEDGVERNELPMDDWQRKLIGYLPKSLTWLLPNLTMSNTEDELWKQIHLTIWEHLDAPTWFSCRVCVVHLSVFLFRVYSFCGLFQMLSVIVHSRRTFTCIMCLFIGTCICSLVHPQIKCSYHVC